MKNNLQNLIDAAKEVVDGASHMQQMTESGQVYASPEMAVSIMAMERLRQTLAAIEQEPSVRTMTVAQIAAELSRSAKYHAPDGKHVEANVYTQANHLATLGAIRVIKEEV